MSNYRSAISDFTEIMQSDTFKKLKEFLGINVGEKTLKWVEESGKKFLVFLDEHGDALGQHMDTVTDYLKKNTIKWQLFDDMEQLDVATLKDIVGKTKPKDAQYVALLKLGRNKKDELEIYVHYMDKNKNLIDRGNLFYLIRCGGLSKELKSSFGDKEMMLVDIKW